MATKTKRPTAASIAAARKRTREPYTPGAVRGLDSSKWYAAVLDPTTDDADAQRAGFKAKGYAPISGAVAVDGYDQAEVWIKERDK